MSKRKKSIIYEEIPFIQQEKTLGGQLPAGCKCSDYCSCYSDEKDSHISNATDTAEEI